MKAICIYVDRGEEYKATAELICNELKKRGHEAVVEELFDYLDIRWLDIFFSFAQKIKKVFRLNNDSYWELNRLLPFTKKHCDLAFKSNLEEEPTDIFICTHPYANRIVTELRRKTNNSKLYVYYYETKFFSPDKRSINNDIDKYFIATESGAKEATLLGQDNNNIEISPFVYPFIPSLRKEEKRLSNKVRILIDTKDDSINISKLINNDISAELVLLGCNQDKYQSLKKYKSLEIIYADSNENKYDLFSKVDFIIGSPIRNDMLIALYLSKPYLITEKKKRTADITNYFLEKGIGALLPNDSKKQLATINDFIISFDNKRFDNISFDASIFVKELESLDQGHN